MSFHGRAPGISAVEGTADTPRGFLELDNRLNVVKEPEFQAAQYAAFRRKTDMDTTTLLIIVLVILLLGGGGWYGRGRWY
jgi:hypothetical protein